MFVVWGELCRSNRSKVFYGMVFCIKSQKLLKTPVMRFAFNFNENQTPSQVYSSCFGEIFNSVFLKNTTGWQLASALHSQGGK